MKYRILYGNSVGVFPKAALDVIKRAGADDLKVLLCLCATEGSADDKKLRKITGCSEGAVRDALAFWRGAGIIESADSSEEILDEETETETAKETETAAPEEKKQKKKLRRSDELPN